MKTNIALVIALLVGVQACFSQGFVNLNFESARIIPIVGSPFYPYAVELTNAYPGWTVNGETQGLAMYNNPPLGGETGVMLLATNGVISGNFSVSLFAGQLSFPATISQTGLIPVWALSLLFAAQSGSGTLQLTLGAQNLPFYALSSGPNYTLYGADISAFAGQTQNLMFSVLHISSGLNIWNIDNIQFSSSPVLEPSSLVLVSLGGLLLGCRRWKNALS